MNQYLESEIWKDVEGFEGLYQVSNHGRVKSSRRFAKRKSKNGDVHILRCGINSILSLEDSGNGYQKIHLHKAGKRYKFWVHRLVAMAFVANPLNKPEVNHIDSNRKNNIYSNLEWVTPSENMKHCFRVGRSKILQIIKTGSQHWGAKQVRQLTIDGKVVKEWECISDAAKSVNKRTSDICAVFSGKQKTSGGFKWERIENGVKL